MKRSVLLIGLGVIIFLASCKTQKVSAPTVFALTNDIDTISYIIGADVAGNLKANGIDINPDIFMQGFKDKINSADTLFAPEEIQEILAEFQKELQIKQQEKMNQESLENKMKGKEFLTENKNKPGVIETSSGLQYKVIQEGTGRKPLATSDVTVHYEGKLIDGTIFDSSYQRGETITFKLNQVIPGWTEGLQLMTEGSTYELYIPAELGYGDRSIPGIPAGSVLIFKVELFSFE
jgi:FKBP-type peptidyl-prolyl cis-trans isomerase FklB